MNGAESLVHTLLKSGVDTCFANPGTSEMHFVAALDRIPGMRCVLGLFEGVVTGAADGYGRVTGKPAATLLHCGPGLGNGLANLHNARRASTPMVNIVGDQATYHRPFDPPLTADAEGWARGVSGWVRTAMDVSTVGTDAAAAAQAAQISPGQIATLILPSDTSWNEGGIVAEALPRLPTPLATPGQIDEMAALVDAAERCAAAQPAAIRERLQKMLASLADLVPGMPEERMTQEIALLVARSDIREELERLRAHLEQASDLLDESEAVGRRLDFLCQELNREANTLCSKSADIELTRIGVSLKAAVEQFREQVQNIE